MAVLNWQQFAESATFLQTVSEFREKKIAERVLVRVDRISNLNVLSEVGKTARQKSK